MRRSWQRHCTAWARVSWAVFFVVTNFITFDVPWGLVTGVVAQSCAIKWAHLLAFIVVQAVVFWPAVISRPRSVLALLILITLCTCACSLEAYWRRSAFRRAAAAALAAAVVPLPLPVPFGGSGEEEVSDSEEERGAMNVRKLLRMCSTQSSLARRRCDTNSGTFNRPARC